MNGYWQTYGHVTTTSIMIYSTCNIPKDSPVALCDQSSAHTPGIHWSALCYYSFDFSTMSYEYIIQTFLVCLLSLNIMFWDSSMLLHVSIVCTFPLVSSTQLNEWNIVCLFIYQLTDIWSLFFSCFSFILFLDALHGLWDLSFLIRDQTCAPYNGSTES